MVLESTIGWNENAFSNFRETLFSRKYHKYFHGNKKVREICAKIFSMKKIFVKTVKFSLKSNHKVSWITHFYFQWGRTAGTGQLIQDNLDRTATDRTARAWRPGQDSLNRTTETGQSWQISRKGEPVHASLDKQRKEDGQNVTARTRLGQDNRDRTTVAEQPAQDSRDRIVKTGQLEHVRPGRLA